MPTVSIDGGGVTVLGSLNIIREAMNRLKEVKKLAEAPRPCDVFDLMSGTGMGACVFILDNQLPSC